MADQPAGPGLLDQVKGALKNPGAAFDAFNSLVELSQKPGFNEFKAKFTANTPEAKSLHESLAQVMGAGAGAGDDIESQSATLKKLGAMAEHDPEIFNKLNRVIDAKGLDGFLKTIGGNPELKTLLEVSDGPGGTAGTAKTIDALDKALQEDPDFLVKANELITKHPQLVASAAQGLSDDPSAGIETMKTAIYFNDMKNGVLDFVKGFSPGLADMLGGLLDNLIDSLGPQLMGMFGPAAAAPAEVAGAAQKGELQGVTNNNGGLARDLVAGLLPGQTLTATAGPDGTVTYNVASASPDNRPQPTAPAPQTAPSPGSPV